MFERKFLIIAPAWIGDLVMAQALFKHLKQNDPNIQIDVVAPAWNYPLLQRMPEVTSAIELSFKHGELSLIRRYYLGKNLQDKGYTDAIILPNSWKAALIPWFAKIPHRIGWRGEYRFGLINDLRYLNKITYPKMVERYVALAYPNNYILPKKLLNPQLLVDPKNLETVRAKFLLAAGNANLPILALGIGAAFGSAKCWPDEYFVQLAYTAAKDNKFNVWIFGTMQNLPIDANIPNIVNFSGKTNLLETLDLLSLADIVVCNDSGLMHLAASLNKKIICMYGPTTEEFVSPLTNEYTVINKKLPCSPCFARECPLGHHNCMKQITVAEVFAQVEVYANSNC